MNTAWCPYRYVTNSLWYAIAYAAALIESDGEISIRDFRGEFCGRVFGVECSDALHKFLDVWPELEITGDLAKKILGENEDAVESADAAEREKKMESLRSIVREGRGALEAAADFTPADNPEIWRAMRLSARIAVVCAESMFLQEMHAGERGIFEKELNSVLADAEREWDLTRYSDDPLKHGRHFKEPASSYLLPILREIKNNL
jgi:hypothetical protein